MFVCSICVFANIRQRDEGPRIMASLVEVHACMPSAERGEGILVGGDANSSSIIYCNGRSVIIRSLLYPLRADVYREHAYPVTVARSSPNGQWVASGDVSGTVRIWGSGAEHVLRYEYRALSGRIDDLQWSHDGDRIVVCGDGKGKSFVRAFMWDSGSSIGEFEGSSKRVLSCAFKPTRPFRIATGGEDFLVNFYEGPPFRFKASHRDHANFVNCVRFAPDGSKFISAGSDKKLVVYDGKSGDKMGVCSAENTHAGSIYAVSWNEASNQVLSVSADKTAKVWNIAADGSGTLQTTFSSTGAPGAEDMQVGCLWLKDFIVTITLGGKMNFWSLDDPSTPKNVLSGHTKSITGVAVSGAEVYSSSYDGVIIKWKLGVGFDSRLESNVSTGVHGLTVVDDVLVACGQNKFVRASVAGEYREECLLDLGAHCNDLSVASANGEMVLACTEQGVILLQGCVVLSKLALPYTPTAVALSPDGKVATIGSKDGKLHVYTINGDTLSEETVLERHRGSITVVRFAPDGSMFASGDENREALVWDSISKEVKLKNMLYHTARIKCMAWALDGSKVATGSVDGCVYVYTIGKPASTRISIKGAHPGGVSGLAFKDPHTLVTGGDDACLRVWNLP